MSLHAGRSLPGEYGCSEQERWSPKSQRAGDKRHRREAEGRQHEAGTEEERRHLSGSYLNAILEDTEHEICNELGS